MTIIELIEEIGMENIRVQNLMESVENAQLRQKGRVTAITFLTAEITPNDFMNEDSQKRALVLWFTKDKKSQAT